MKDITDETTNPALRCYESAVRILGLRGHSASQLRTKLLRKKFEEDIVDDTLDRVRREGWLDENKFAAEVVRSRGRKNHGARRIQRELQGAGLSEETARRAIAENVSPEEEAARLRAACDKKLRAMLRRDDLETVSSEAGRNKLASHLLQRGYEMSAVIDAVDDALRELRTRS